mmetsp:Transcript_16061/g.25173  ORF Transcript_16061/g.25173 Transcript_16061/m.25173 type:complete len:205 (+) Transcript_16061:394-1008(+)
MRYMNSSSRIVFPASGGPTSKGHQKHHRSMSVALPQVLEKPISRKCSGEGLSAVFRAPAEVQLQKNEDAMACVIKVSPVEGRLSISIPSLSKTISLDLTSDNFVIDVHNGCENAFILRLYDDMDEELDSFTFRFSGSYCLTRVIFTLSSLKKNVSINGLCYLTSACIRGNTKNASNETSLSASFFDLHGKDLRSLYPNLIQQFA